MASHNVKFDRSNFNPEITKEARIFMIASDISKGCTYREMQQRYQEEWGLAASTISFYITEAIQALKAPELQDAIKDINFDRLTSIYRQSLEEGDRKSQLKAIDLLNKMAGLYTQKVEVATEDEFKFTFTNKEQ